MWFLLTPCTDDEPRRPAARRVYVDACLHASLPPLFGGHDVAVFDQHGLPVDVHTPVSLLRAVYADAPVLFYSSCVPAAHGGAGRRADVRLQGVHPLQLDPSLRTWLSTSSARGAYEAGLEKLGCAHLRVDGWKVIGVAAFAAGMPRRDATLSMRLRGQTAACVWLESEAHGPVYLRAAAVKGEKKQVGSPSSTVDLPP